jgi:multiple sugar transport system ATP-binding protein
MGEIVFENAWKVFRDGTAALKGLDLEVPDGEFFVFLGPSGSGKTTLLRSVAGLEKLTDGRIVIARRDVTDESPKERNVAMVFQNYSLYPHMNVFDNMAFGIQSRRLPKDEINRRVQRAAEILELEPLLKKRPRVLSGGQQQRVAMGRAIVREPEAFLMDEPLSNLDPRTRAQIRGEIARIQRAVGVTTLYVTHDQAEAMTLGDRVGVLRDGELQQVDAPKSLYREPANLFVAGFVGSPPMNLAEATIEDEGIPFLRVGSHSVRILGPTGAPAHALKQHARRQVVAGIRPEDLDEAQRLGAPPDARFRLTVDRLEELGGDVHLYFEMDAPLLLSEDPRAGEPLSGAWPLESGNQWMARLRSSAAVEGDVVELGVRPGRLLLFDPRSGTRIDY